MTLLIRGAYGGIDRPRSTCGEAHSLPSLVELRDQLERVVWGVALHVVVEVHEGFPPVRGPPAQPLCPPVQRGVGVATRVELGVSVQACVVDMTDVLLVDRTLPVYV